MIFGDGENYIIKGLEIFFVVFGDEGYVYVESEKLFVVSFSVLDEVVELRNENIELREKLVNLMIKYNKFVKENEQFKQQVLEFQSKFKNQFNIVELNVKILNLMRENCEFKVQLVNLMNQYNVVKVKVDFFEQQNDEYRKMIQIFFEDVLQKSEQSYIEKVKKEKLVGFVIIKVIVFSVIVVGLIGYGLYRKKRLWEFGGF